MPQFLYKAKDQKGAIIEGSMEATGQPMVVQRLQQMGYFPIAIELGVRKGGKTVAAKPNSAVAKAVAAGKPARSATPAPSLFRRRLKTSDLASFNRQLADLIGSGVPLVKGLQILARQQLPDELKVVVDDVLVDVQGGATFADALTKHPRIFSKLFIAMVRSGEAGGMLDQVLQRLADTSEMEETLRGRVKSALAYPVVMILAGTGAIFVMFTVVIPRITETFEQLNQTLPPMTQFLIDIANWLSHWWWAALIAIVAGTVAGWRFLKTNEGRTMWHRAQLRLPIFGEIVRKRETARFTRTLGSLLQNGVPILAALDIVREVANNSIFAHEVNRIAEAIMQGSGVADPLRTSAVFPPVAVNMIAIGEETGRLPDVLTRVSETNEAEVDRQLRTLTSLLEPIIIVSMGFVVAFVVIAMLLPIFTLDPSGGGG